jgi:adenylyltransferase/sulfurtransferase
MDMEKIHRLREEITKREAELAALKSQLAAAESQNQDQDAQAQPWKWPLDPHEYERYSRQMIVPNFGLEGKYDPFHFFSYTRRACANVL